MLIFEPFQTESIPKIAALAAMQSYRTCDYSIGGIYMWIRYFDYAYCVCEETLYIKCRAENYTAFMLPVGRSPLTEALGNLREYCAAEGIPLRLCAVPQEALPLLPPGCRVEHTRQWDDYLYEAPRLGTYAGHALKDKRNRMNHFENTYAYAFEKLDSGNLADARLFVERFAAQESADADYFRDYENEETRKMLGAWSAMPFAGYLVRVGGEIVGLIAGEKVNDTLFIHVEKSYHAYAGINEWLTSRYVRELTRLYPDIAFVNREEDMGDEGLRRSKTAFCPLRLLEKYMVYYE